MKWAVDRLRGRPLDQDGFARKMRAELARAGVAAEAEIVYDTAGFLLRLGSGEGPTMHLSKLYADYLHAAPEQREHGIHTAVAAMAVAVRTDQEPIPPDQARASMRVQLKPRVWAVCHRAIHRPLAERLALCLCVDIGAGILFPKPDDVSRWGLDDETAFKVGIAGLERDTGTEGGLVRGDDGVYHSTWADTYDASRAALPWLVRKVPAAGGRALGLPNRDTLLVADLADADALVALAAAVEREAGHPRLVTFALFALPADSDDLVPLRLPDGHPADAAVRKLRALDAMQQYGYQKERLDEELVARGEDVYVASVAALRDAAGRTMTWAPWPEGVDAMVPRTDLVAMGAAGPEGRLQLTGLFPFERVQAVCGDLMEVVPECPYPPRWRVRRSPDPQRMTALGEPVDPGRPGPGRT